MTPANVNFSLFLIATLTHARYTFELEHLLSFHSDRADGKRRILNVSFNDRATTNSRSGTFQPAFSRCYERKVAAVCALLLHYGAKMLMVMMPSHTSSSSSQVCRSLITLLRVFQVGEISSRCDWKFSLSFSMPFFLTLLIKEFPDLLRKAHRSGEFPPREQSRGKKD